MHPCVRPSDQREELQARNLHKTYTKFREPRGWRAGHGAGTGCGPLGICRPEPGPVTARGGFCPQPGPLHAAKRDQLPWRWRARAWGRPALTGSVLAAVLCQLRPGGPERVHRLPQGQLLLHLLPAQGRLPPGRGGAGGCSPWPLAFGLWSAPSPGPPCLFPPFGLPSEEVKRVFSRGLAAASLGPASSPLGLRGISA